LFGCVIPASERSLIWVDRPEVILKRARHERVVRLRSAIS
jgi:hypothetical protein